MEKFEVHILGCGSAKPTLKHMPSCQVLNVHEQLFMIDCGEGSQLQFCRQRLSFSRLNHIFISHLHGDHCFGLPGLISTLSLLGRTAPLHVYGPNPLESLLRPLLDFHCAGGTFEVVIHEVDAKGSLVVLDNKLLTVKTIPLDHRIPCCGWLFEEKAALPHINREITDFYGIPHYELSRIKEGADWVTADGDVIANSRLVRPAAPPRRYAYLSDTAYVPANALLVSGVDLLYHETTFTADCAEKAKQTRHSTTRQAAEFALKAGVGRLLIGHYSSSCEDEALMCRQCKEIFPNTMYANEGMCVKVGQ